MIYPEECSLCTWGECVFCCCWIECPVYVHCFKVWFNSNVSLLNLDDLKTADGGTQKSPIIIALLFTSPLSSGACMLGAYIFTIVSSWYTDLFTIIQWPSLSLVKLFDLKSILSDISMAILNFLWFPFICNIINHPFTLSLCVSLELKSLL